MAQQLGVCQWFHYEDFDQVERAAAMAARGRRTLLRRHTCAHRADELMRICRSLGLNVSPHPPRRRPDTGTILHA